MEVQPEVIFGINAIREKLKASPDEVAEILICGGPSARAIGAEAARLNVRVTYVKNALLDRLSMGQRHQGAVARVAPFHYGSFDALLDSPSSAPQRVLCLDSVTDPQNFGALLRSADGAGVAHVVIPKDRSVTVTPSVIKASAGAAHHVKIYRVTNLRRALEELKQSGHWLIGLEDSAPTSIYARSYPERLGIVLGGEGQGMRPLVRQQCDFLVSIPMAGKLSSLNVAVAGALFLYELHRQQGAIDKEEIKR